MPTPPKPAIMLETEKKSHRTKRELKQRKKGEAELLTGKKLTEKPEIKKIPAAHKEYLRINRLLKSIGKNDAIYTNIINRYCRIYAECLELEDLRDEFSRGLEELREQKEDLKPSEYYRLLNDMQKNIVGLDNLCAAKRRMMLDIEKECVMTIASALRSVPKKPEKEDQEDPMAVLLGKRRA